MTLATLVPLVLKLSIALFVFAIGLKASPSDLTYPFRWPGQLARAILAMNVLMPLFAFFVCSTFELNPAVKIALVALSCSPIPPFLPNKAIKAGGHENYTIGLLVASALLSIILVPLTMRVFESVSGVPMQMRPRDVAALVLTSVLIPLLLGIVVRRFASSFAERAAKPISTVALVLMILPLLPILFSSLRAVLTLVGDGTLLVLAAFAVTGLIVGHLLGGPEARNRPVLALATSARHPAVAIAIAHVNFPNQKLAGALVLIYLVLSTILAAPYLNWIKRTHSETTAGEKQAA